MVIKKDNRNVQFFTLLILCSVLFVTACGKMTGEELGNEASWENGQGQLSEQIGGPENVSKSVMPSSYHYFNDYIDVIEKTTYDMPTSRWFIHDDEGEFGYGLPSGTTEAGASYEIKLYPKNNQRVQVNRNVRIQLTTRNHALEQSELVMEEIIHVDTVGTEEVIYFGQLPKKENVIYVLSVEILNKQDQVEDTMASMIYVPTPEINAKLTTDKNVYEASVEQATIMLENDGPTFLVVGTSYTVEKKVNDTWRVVPLNIAFDDIGILINPADPFDQPIALEQLTPGKYRVIKTIHADGLDLSATLAAEFTME